MATRYPLEALADALGVPLASLGRLLDLTGSTWVEYRDRGVTERVADRLAVKAGLPTLAVWPEIEAEAERECDRDDCPRRFIPTNARQRFCSAVCRSTVSARARRAADPAKRERARRYSAAYYAECGESVKAKARRRYWSDPEAHRERARLNRQKAAA